MVKPCIIKKSGFITEFAFFMQNTEGFIAIYGVLDLLNF